MKTFLSWLIANLGGAVYTVLIIGFEAMLFCGRIPVPEEAGTAGMALYGPLILVSVFGMAGGLPARSVTEDLINLLLLAAVYAAAFIFRRQSPAWELFVWGLAPALAVSVAVGLFTARNMALVVSRRMLWRNSASDLFGIKLQYTFNRAVAAMNASTAIYLFARIPQALEYLI